MINKRGKRYLFVIIQILALCSILVHSCYAFWEEPEWEPEQRMPSEDFLKEDFRFVEVEKAIGIFEENTLVYVETNETSRTLGEGAQGGLCYILQRDGEWLYIESGDVRGFVKSTDIIQKEEAQEYIAQLVNEERRVSITLDIDQDGNIKEHYFDTSHETMLELARPLVVPTDNESYAYTKTTTQQVLVEKQQLVSKGVVEITEEKEGNNRVLGILPTNGLAFCILEEDDWYYVESGDVRGFARVEEFYGKEEFTQAGRPEEEYALADEIIAPAENRSLYYTLASIKEEDTIKSLRESLVLHAQQITNTELKGSADGHEFMCYMYEKYGYEIPITIEAQMAYGKVISMGQVRPGDLVFGAQDGGVSEPAMYIGNEKVLRFLNSSDSSDKSTIVEDIEDMTAMWAIDFLSPPIEEHLGEFKLTAYCKCVKCSGQSESPTALGTMPVEGRTIAMGDIALGTTLSFDGKIYVVEDRGTPYGHIDIFVDDHEEYLEFGVNYASVSKIW